MFYQKSWNDQIQGEHLLSLLPLGRPYLKHEKFQKGLF